MRRLQSLYDDIGKPVFVIKLNPDSYRTMDGCMVPGCWSLTPVKGLLTVPKDQARNWDRRISKLDNIIRQCMDLVSRGWQPNMIQVIHLYYDGAEEMYTTIAKDSSDVSA